jgi:hypothetical protein
MNRQERVNMRCLLFANMAGLDFAKWHSDFIEFDSSKAAFVKTKDYIVLCSFGRIAALYCISSGTAVDILRYKRGYKIDSISHVEKFFKLMNALFGINKTLCYQDVYKNYKEK